MTLALAIPVRNDRDGLCRLLEQAAALSIFDQLVIFDDASEPPIDPGWVPSALRETLVLLRTDAPAGAGAARNRALEAVVTDHVLFFDSDDLFTDELPRLWRSLSVQSFDFCLFRHNDSRVSSGGGWGQMPYDDIFWRQAGLGGASLQEVAAEALLPLAETSNYPWNKIYRTDFLRDNNLSCTEIPIHNDVELHWMSFLKAQTVLVSDRIAAIHFVQTTNSRLTNQTGRDRLLVFQALDRVAGTIRAEQGPDSELLLSFFRFSNGLADWILENLEATAHDDLELAMRAFLATHLDADVLRAFLKSDAFLARSLLRRMTGGQSEVPVGLEAAFSSAEPETRPSIVISDTPLPKFGFWQKWRNLRAPKKDLVFHIGDFKTGSTSIQYALERGLVSAPGRRILFPRCCDHRILAKTLEDPDNGWERELQFRTLNDELQHAGWDTAVVSSEQFEFYDPALLYEALRRWLPDYAGAVRIVVYLRPHASRILANWAEHIKQGFTFGPIEERHAWLLESRRLFYAERIARWKRWFGDAVIVRAMVPEMLYLGDVAQDFFHVIFGEEGFSLQPIERKNQSLCLQDLAALREIHMRIYARDPSLLPHQHAFAWACAPYLATLPNDDAVRPALHRALAEEIRQTYRADAQQIDRDIFAQSLFAPALDAAMEAALPEPQPLDAAAWFDAQGLRLIHGCADMVERLLSRDPTAFTRALEGL